MTRYISHRGNLRGPSFPENENSLTAITAAIHHGFEVEIDVQDITDMESFNFVIHAGHDKADHVFSYRELPPNQNLWFHAKTYDALLKLSKYHDVFPNIDYFWHEKDAFTLTGRRIIWAYPNNKMYPKAVCVLPELILHSVEAVHSQNLDFVCTDYPILYRDFVDLPVKSASAFYEKGSRK